MSGRGIFTTIAIRGGEPFLWEKHWSRLVHAAEKLDIDLAEFDASDVKVALSKKLADDNVIDGRAKLTFSDNRTGKIWPERENTAGKTALSIITGPLRQIPERFRLNLSPYPVNSRSPLAGIKSTDYLEPTLCFEAAQNTGFDEAVRVNERGQVTSACFANIFWMKAGIFYTPDLTTGCLAGTTREFILENLEVVECVADIDELLSAEGIFLSSAGIGIVEAASLENRTFSPGHHPILDLLDAGRQ